jgi:hypothetical protein
MKNMETVSKKTQKTGRPAKAIKKEIRACVRFTRSEYFIIKVKASQAGVKASAYIRQTAIKSKIVPRLSEDEIHFVRQLAGMSTNMNQVAKVCHREGALRSHAIF